MIHIGKFELLTGKVLVTDPCYDPGTWCAGELNNMKTGIWTGFIDYWCNNGEYSGKKYTEQRVGNLIAYHEDFYKDLKINARAWKDSGISVGVDSGQAGIFEESKYRTPQVSTTSIALKSVATPKDKLRLAQLQAKRIELLETWATLRESNPEAAMEAFIEHSDLHEDIRDLTRKISGEERESWASERAQSEDPEEAFYGACCEITLGGLGGGTLEYGIVSSSGFGDGGYKCYTIEEEGQIVAVKINYI